MILVDIFLVILLWNMADTAWEDGRTGMGNIYLFLSALCGALALSIVF